MSSRLLDVSSLDVSYGKIRAVRGVDLRVRAGEIVALIGPNGAGKTTLLSALIGVLPASGCVLYDEIDIGRWDIEARVEAGLAMVPETRELFGSMSVADNLLLGGFMHRRRPGYRPADESQRIYDLFPRLRERANQRADQLSGGERQMLAIGRALMGRPRLLMLDEPSLGLAPLVVRETFRMLDGLRHAGCSLLLVEQNARAALRVADYAYVIEQGAIVLAGAAAELAQDSRVAATYLGLARRIGSAA
jgi:branched-chain amino acid transport system ATP-binding protein